MNYEEDEVPKYKKKKESSTSRSREKSKHKHEYIDCLLIDEDGRPHMAAYCKLCGKIEFGKSIYDNMVKTGHGGYRFLSSEEMFEKYRDFPQVHVKDICQKYVPINKR